MPDRISFIHSFSALPATFDRLVEEYLPGAQTTHVVDGLFYQAEFDRGHLSEEEEEVLVDYARTAERHGSSAVVVTCSFLGTSVDKLRDRVGIPWLRVDEPMVREALGRGRSIGIIATAGSSLASTETLVERLMREGGGAEQRITTRLCDGAFEALASGDKDAHDASVSRALLELADVTDVIVLSQASMAPVAEALGDRLRVPVLSSPQLCMQHLARLLN